KEAAVFWLSYNWASPRDREFLSRLRELPPLSKLVGEPGENKRWNKGQGFKPARANEKNAKTPFWGPDQLFLDARRRFDLLLSHGDTRRVDPAIQALHRSPDERLFKSPLVVFNKGFSNIAFVPFDIVFRHALQAISGPETDRNLLMFLGATFLSPLAEYYVFHLTSKPIYRGNQLLTEILRMPFPLPQEAPSVDAAGAVRAGAETFTRVASDSRLDGFGREQLVRDAKRELTKQVYSYFDVDS